MWVCCTAMEKLDNNSFCSKFSHWTFCNQLVLDTTVGVVHPSSSSMTQSAGDMLLRPTTPRLLSLGSIEGKCPNTTRSAASTECCHPKNKEEEPVETCSKACSSWVAHAVLRDCILNFMVCQKLACSWQVIHQSMMNCLGVGRCNGHSLCTVLSVSSLGWIFIQE